MNEVLVDYQQVSSSFSLIASFFSSFFYYLLGYSSSASFSSSNSECNAYMLPSVPFHNYSFYSCILPVALNFIFAHIFLMFVFFFLMKNGKYGFPEHGINRILCIFHSLVSCNWSILLCICEYSYSSFGVEMSDYQRKSLSFSMGYFIYDSFYSMYAYEIDSIIHHIVCMIGLLYGIYYNIAGTEMKYGIAIGEFITPLLHLRYFLNFYCTQKRQELLLKIKEENNLKNENNNQNKLNFFFHHSLCYDDIIEHDTTKKKQRIFKVKEDNESKAKKKQNGKTGTNSINGEDDINNNENFTDKLFIELLCEHVSNAFGILFIFVRGVLFPVLVYFTVKSKKTPIVIKMCSVLMFFLSVFWVLVIVKIAVKKKKVV